MAKLLLVIIVASVTICVSRQQCPNGWRKSTVFPNKCYLVVVGKRIWFEAGAYCAHAATGSVLTSVNSAFENYAMNAIVTDTPAISQCDQLWIGANDFDQNGIYAWTDNNPFQYSNWGPGQPDLSQQCVSSTARTTGFWKTEPCGTENCFICELYVDASGTSTPNPSTMQTTTTTSTMSMTTTTTTPTTTTKPTNPSTMTQTAADCLDLYDNYGVRESGIYSILLPGLGQIQVYCDMHTDGGGWTVFHRRQDGSLAFESFAMNDYKFGFQNKNYTNYWLGLEAIHILSTKDNIVDLRIDIVGDRNPAHSCTLCSWNLKAPFTVGSEQTGYQLQLSPLASTFDIPIYYSNGMPFGVNSCAQEWHSGGWWFYNCFKVNLNGRYAPEGNCPYGTGNGDQYSYCWIDSNSESSVATWTSSHDPITSEMKLRKQAVQRDTH